MDDVVGAIEEGGICLWAEDICALPGDFVCPWRRSFGGSDCVPGWFTGAAGFLSEKMVNWWREELGVPEGDDVPAAGDGVFAYSGA